MPKPEASVPPSYRSHVSQLAAVEAVTYPLIAAPLPERDSGGVSAKGGHSRLCGKKELAEQIIRYTASVEVDVGEVRLCTGSSRCGHDTTRIA